ncbi:MAG: CAAX prenyl protease-related protein [Deltaproteobacteria bacterium]|nr:CAAX prenyl protease-related protein [Deltaproteobacteria bacterium]
MPALASHPAVPYVLPFALFLLLTELARWIPNSLLWIYPLKTVVAGTLLLWFRKTYSEIMFEFSWLAVAVGVLVLLLWIPLYGGYFLLSEPQIVNPYELTGSLALPWIAIRLLGSSIVVPVMEELFWRSFLLRYLVNPDFRQVPIGTLTTSAVAISVVLFGVEHNQWLAGIVAGLLYTLLLYRTKSLFSCIVAHAVTNFLLGVYVLMTEQWQYW